MRPCRRPSFSPCLLALLLAVTGLAACGDDDAVTNPGATADAANAVDTAAPTPDVAPAADATGTTGGIQPCVTVADCAPVAAPCQAAACVPQVGCIAVALPDGAVCDDGSACTVSGLCAKGACVAGAKLTCDDGDPCTADGCDSLTGCVHAPAADDTVCEDGNTCTEGDSCQGGQCQAGNNACGCQTTADCAAAEDGNACNGTLYCDKSNPAQPQCKINPASVVHCPTAGDTACLKNACNRDDGTCTPTPVESAIVKCAGADCDWLVKKAGEPTGTLFLCDDGDACTTVDECKGGQCQPGKTNTCGCQSDAACGAQEDGNACNGTLFCNKALSPPACQLNPATVVSCPSVDDTTCAKNECNPKSGKCEMVATADQDKKPCDDGNPCTTGEVCQAGQCAATANTCICKADSDCAGQDDGDFCNGTMYCNLQKGQCEINPATVVVCPSVDDTPCQVNTCQGKTGQCALVAINEAKPCDDGNPCTATEVCTKGQCVGTATCDCQSDADCAGKENGNLCDGTLYCDKTQGGKCVVNPATIVQCSKSFDTACQQNQCNPMAGVCAMVPVNQGQPCEDGEPCTKGDACHLGTCTGGPSTCECLTNADCLDKDDGNFCNGTPYCNKQGLPWVCETNPATVVTCKTVDDTFCAQNQCQPKTGLCELTAVHQGLACEDGTQCTSQDVCKNGACSGQPVGCKDDVPCTFDSCDPITGCSFDAKPELCDDGKVCTVDVCHPVFGCQSTQGTVTCDDGSKCTTGDTCQDGFCAGKQVACDDGNPCTDDACDPAVGCTQAPNTAACDSGQACAPVGQCAAGKCEALPSMLFSQLVDAAGQDRAAAVLARDGGQAALVGSTTSSGKGKSDFWLVRLDAFGKVLAQTTVGSDADEVATAAVGTSDGGGVAVGSVTPGPNGLGDAFLVRFGLDGLPVWKQVAGGKNDDAALAVAAFGKDELVVSGRKGKDGGGHQLWLLRVSAVGTVLWEKALPGDEGIARAVAAVPGGGFVVAGERKGADGKPRFAVVRTDANGLVIWAKQLDGLPGAANAVVALADGGAVAAGWQGAAKDDARLVRLNAKGDVVYDQLYGGAGAGEFTALVAQPGGTLGFVGWQEADGGPQLWLGRVDLAGKPVWERQIGPAKGGAAPALAIFPDQAHLVAATWAGADSQQDAARVVRTDPWGYATCEGQGDCAGKKAASCDDANPCTNDACNALLGCTHGVNALACDDGNACTENDTCDAGECAKGSSGSCDDGNACSVDTCDEEGGCKHTPAAGKCDDGNACTKGDQCVTSLCKPGPVDTCDDGNACTTDSCDSKKGCAHAVNTADCESGNCTYDDKCVAGFCQSSGKSGFVDQMYGTSFADRAHKVEQVGQDGFVLIGDSYASGDSDQLVVRVDANGKQLWSSVVKPPVNCCGFGSNDSTTTDYGRAILPTPFGFVTAGYTSLCFGRAHFSRLDHNGKVVWNRTYSPAGNWHGCTDGNAEKAFAFDLVDGNDGTFAVFGYRFSHSFTPGTLRGWFGRFDQNGTFLVNAYISPGGPTQLYGGAPAGGGGFFAVGYTDFNSAGGHDAYVARLDINGNEQWQKLAGGAAHDYALDAWPAPDGGVLVAARTASKGAGFDDAWLLRYDAGGKLLWDRTYGGSANDGLQGAVVVPGGSIVTAGYTFSGGAGAADLQLMGLDPGGNLQWSKLYGDAKDDYGLGITPLVSGGFAIAGYGTPPKADAHDFRLLVTDAFGNGKCPDSGACFAQTAADCDDGDFCTADACHKVDGCVHTPATWACDDGDACTAGDVCVLPAAGKPDSGKCAGKAVTCDDAKPCTVDTCDPKSGCKHANAVDGTECGGGKKCAAGVCK